MVKMVKSHLLLGADRSQWLLDVTDVLPMMIDVYPIVAKESSGANPQKVAKIDENELATLL